MHAAILIMLKDLAQRARDRSAFLIALVVPLALGSIFSLVLSDVADDTITFQYVVADEDRGEAARVLTDHVLREVAAGGRIRIREVASAGEARELVRDGDAAAAFVVPSGFSRAVASGRSARLSILGDDDARIGVLVARSIAQGYSDQLTAVQVAVGAVAVARGGTLDPGTARELASRATTIPAPVGIEDRSASRKDLTPATFYAAGMAVFFLFFTVQFGVSSMLDERREGTLARLLAAPIRRRAILAGKALTSVVLGVVSMSVLAATTSLLIGADWGSPGGVAILIVCGVLAATAVMSLVATLARTPEQAGYWQAIVAVLLGMLGGGFFPVAQAGGVIEWLSLVTPHAWFLRGLTELAAGGGPTSVAVPAFAMLAFAAVCGGGALLRAERMVHP